MGLIIPTGFHIFQRGRLNHQPVIYNHFGAISPNLGQLRYVFWDLRLNFGYTDNRYGTFFGETFDLKTISHQWSRWFRRSNLRRYIYIQRHIITVKALSPDIRTSCSIWERIWLVNLRRYAGVFRYAWLPLTQKNGLEHARHLAILFLLPKGTKRYSHSEQWFNFVNPKSQKVGWLTRYTLDRRPWHEMGFSAKNSMFFDVPHFALFQTTAKQHFIAFFSSLFQKLFQLF